MDGVTVTGSESSSDDDEDNLTELDDKREAVATGLGRLERTGPSESESDESHVFDFRPSLSLLDVGVVADPPARRACFKAQNLSCCCCWTVLRSSSCRFCCWSLRERALTLSYMEK